MQLDPTETQWIDDYRDSLVPAHRADRNWDALLRRIDAGDEPRVGPEETLENEGEDGDRHDEREDERSASAVRRARARSHRAPVWAMAAAAVLFCAAGVAAWSMQEGSTRALRGTAFAGGSADMTRASYSLEPMPPHLGVQQAVGKRMRKLPAPDGAAALEPVEHFTHAFDASVAGDAVVHGPRRAKSRTLEKPVTSSRHARESLTGEARLIGGARAALRDHNSVLAMRLLERHERVFPRGLMEEERRALKVAALCLRGDAKAARLEARAFLREYRNSPLAANVAKRCDRVTNKP